MNKLMRNLVVVIALLLSTTTLAYSQSTKPNTHGGEALVEEFSFLIKDLRMDHLQPRHPNGAVAK